MATGAATSWSVLLFSSSSTTPVWRYHGGGAEGWQVLVGGVWWCLGLCQASSARSDADAAESGLLPWSRACNMYVLSRAKASTKALSVVMVAVPLGCRFLCWGHH
jgi:hypothetical protein